MATNHGGFGGGGLNLMASPASEAPPQLYPLRALPKSLRRKPRDNRILLAAQTIEDHLVFSGYRLDDENSNDTRFRFRSVIGKQSIYQELDLQATLAQPNLTTAITQRINQQSTVAGHQSNNNINLMGDGEDESSSMMTNPTSTNKKNSGKNSNKSAHYINPTTPPSQTFDIVSNADLTLYGTAMMAFPAELRRFFYKIAEPNHYHPTDHRPSLSRGMALYRHYTNLGPFSPMDKTLPVRYSHNYDKTKSQIFTAAMDELLRSITIQFGNRYQTRYVNPPPTLAARAKKQQQLQAAKLKKMLKKGKSAGGMGSDDDNDDDDDDDDNNNNDRRKRRGSNDGKKSKGGSDNEDDDNNDGDESGIGSDSDGSEESELDFDMGEVHDDDDDDYGGGASGEDEPTF